VSSSVVIKAAIIATARMKAKIQGERDGPLLDGPLSIQALLGTGGTTPER
jgi:hypothetical protein